MADSTKPIVVMGVLHSTKGKTNRNRFAARYAKHFWVANTTKGILECFKNDQAVIPKATIDASQIVGVNVVKDKQNKFFELQICLRKGKERRFRLSSRDERNRWLAAVTDIIKNRRSTNCRMDNIVSVVQTRLSACADLIRVEMSLSLTHMFSIRDELLDRCLEATDVAVEVIKTVAARLAAIIAAPSSADAAAVGDGGGGDGSGDISHYLRRIEVTLTEAVRGAPSADVARYDPSSKTLFVVVNMLKDPTSGRVTFQHHDATALMGVLTSNIWRDPNIEGWVSSDPTAQEHCSAITQLLQLEEPFSVSMVWCPMDEDVEGLVLPYLDRYVRAVLLEDLFKQLSILITQEEGKDPAACRTLARYVTGAAIRLNQVDIREDRPPSILLMHNMFRTQELSTGLLIVSKYRKLTVMPAAGQLRNPVQEFVHQMREVLLYSRVAESCTAVQRELSDIVQCRDGAEYDFESLVAMLASVQARVVVDSLPQVIQSVHQTYARRADRLVKNLVQLGIYERPFQFCTAYYSVQFEAFRATDGPSFPVLQPNGTFVDYIVGINGETPGALEHAQYLYDVNPKPIPGIPDPQLCLFHPVEQLVTWFRGFFSNAENVRQAPERRNDDDSSSSGGGSDDEQRFYDNSEVFVRVAEARVLSLADCETVVYDSQEGTELGLKVDAKTVIREAMANLNDTFRKSGLGDIAKHDLIRVMIFSLQRLRDLFAVESQALYQRIQPSVPRASACSILRAYCEYQSSLALIAVPVGGTLLTQSKGDVSGRNSGGGAPHSRPPQVRRSLSSSQTDTAAAAASSPSPPGSATIAPDEFLGFEEIAKFALCKLLPNEALLSQRSRRQCLVLGHENTGKTLIIDSLRGLSQPTVPSVGLSETVVAYDRWVLAMRELGGRELFRRSWKQYFAHMVEMDAIMFIVDGARVADLVEAGEFLRAVRKWKSLGEVPLLVVFNNMSSADRAVPPTATAAETLPNGAELQLLDMLGVKFEVAGSVFCVSCNVTSPQSTHRGVLPGIQRGMDWLCAQLLARSPPDSVPSALKPE